MDTPISSPKSIASEHWHRDDSRLGYGGCYTCGAIVPCATMVAILIEMPNGATLPTLAYDCAPCSAMPERCADCDHLVGHHRVDPDLADCNDPPYPCIIDGCRCCNVVDE